MILLLPSTKLMTGGAIIKIIFAPTYSELGKGFAAVRDRDFKFFATRREKIKR